MKERKPKSYNADKVAHTAECAFQRAIIQGKQSRVKDDIITWIDIELPVNDSTSARGKCIDLIGKDSKGRYVLCELKFRKKSDNGGPEEAASQLKEYYQEIKKNAKELNSIKLHHSNASELIDWEKVASDNTRLMVVANKFYWETWCVRKKVLLTEKGVEYYSVNIDRFEFKKQKGDKKLYAPYMPEEGLEWEEMH